MTLLLPGGLSLPSAVGPEPALSLGGETGCIPTVELDVSEGSVFLVSRVREAKMGKYLLRILLK